MKNLIIGLLIIGLTTTGFAQESSNKFEVALEEELSSFNLNYLNAIGHQDAAEPVKLLSQKAASYDLENSICLKADYEKQEFYVQFKIPQGEILVVYNNEGEIIRTSEEFINISLPLSVSNAIVDKYPGWKISSDIYKVKYVKDGELNKTYDLFIEKNNTGKIVIKTDENGKFNVVIPENDTFIKVKVDYSTHSIRTIKFKANKDGSVYARRYGGSPNYFFIQYYKERKIDQNFKWVLDLKDAHAQRISNMYAAKLARVGLDESEWLRRWGQDN